MLFCTCKYNLFWCTAMAHVRSAIPVVLTVGAGFVGYRYIYRSKHREPLQISDDASVRQSLQVWLDHSLTDLLNFWLQSTLVVRLPFLSRCVGKLYIARRTSFNWQASLMVDSFYYSYNLLQFVICASDITRNCFGCR